MRIVAVAVSSVEPLASVEREIVVEAAKAVEVAPQLKPEMRISSPAEKVVITSIYNSWGLPFTHTNPELAAVTLPEAVPPILGVEEALQAAASQSNGKLGSIRTRISEVSVMVDAPLAKILIWGIVEVEPPPGGMRTSNEVVAVVIKISGGAFHW